MKIFTLTAGILGLTGVAMGAFGAHALEEKLAASGHTSTWETAVLYHLIHAVALFAATRDTGNGQPPFVVPGWLWTGGVLLFSGSLYLLALGGPRWLGPVTPLGGLLLMAGWVMIIVHGIRGKGAA